MHIFQEFLHFFTKSHTPKPQISVIACIDKKRGIGYDGELLFPIKKDMDYFSETTQGAAVIMGSKTYLSIPKKHRPLKKRYNIVLTSKPHTISEGAVDTTTSLSAAIKKAQNKGYTSIFIIGGAGLYREGLDIADTLYITQVQAAKPADTYFPEFTDTFNLISESKEIYDEHNKVVFTFQIWQKK